MAARLVLTQQTANGEERLVPVLAYTLVPVVTFRENDGDMTSALVSVLLFHGFQLAMSPDLGDILEEATATSASCGFAVTPQGLITLSIRGKNLFRDQLHTEQPADALWLEAACGGHVLVISGDNLSITLNGLDLRHAAAQGTLVIGTVPVHA